MNLELVVVNVFGSSNRGDAALIEMCLKDVRATFPGAQITGIAYQPELERQHIPDVEWHERPGKCVGHRVIWKRLCNLFRQTLVYSFVWMGRPEVIGKLLPNSQRHAIEAILDAELVISCPGGYLEDSNPSYLAALTQLWIATRGRGKLLLANQSIGPIRSWLGRRYLRYILERCTSIFVREGESERFVRELLGNSHVSVVRASDLAFSLPSLGIVVSEGHKQLELWNGYIAATLVNWSFPESADPVAVRERYIREIAIAFQAVHAQTGLKILIVNQVMADLCVADAVMHECGGDAESYIVVDRRERSVTEVRHLIGGSRAFLGSRFHSCIFALLGNVPTVAISYLPKTTGIMSELGLSHRVGDIKAVSAATLVQSLLTCLKESAAVVAEQKRALEGYRNRYPTFGELLARYAIEARSTRMNYEDRG